ncbi:MAG: FG-GAP-like repeat-containing protein [Candidatus Zixiibacteriota bacterium]
MSVFAADLDGDDDSDLVVANYLSDNVSMLKNNGDGTFAAAVNYPAGSGPLSVVAADLDGDGDADLAVANFNGDNVSLLKNRGGGVFDPAGSLGVGDGPRSVFAADLDGDGDVDLAVANSLTDDVSILFNCTPQFCPCPCHGDPVCDGLLNVVDVIVVAEVFMGQPPIADSGCPYSRTDVDCSGTTDLVDLLNFINVVFFAADPGAQFCQPNPQPCRDTLNPGTCNPGVPTPNNSVVVESKEVSPGATGVQVGVYVQNNTALNGLIIPLEIREVTPGAYIQNSFNYEVTGRLAGSGVTQHSAKQHYRDPDTANLCSGPVSETFKFPGTATGTFFTSPSAIMWSGVNSDQPCLAIGSDGSPGAGTPSLTLTFDVTTTSGEFEIDTCCVLPANHLAFAICNTHDCLLPSFTKGVIRIGAPDTLSCTRSFTDPYLLACPRGDIPFVIHLVSSSGKPWIGDHSIYLDFSSCTGGEFLPQPGVYPNWPLVYVASPSDDSGRVFVSIAAGGDCADCSVSVYADCGLIGTVPVRSVDVDGDACVLPFDSDPVEGLCRDVNADGVVNDADLTRLANHLNHRYPTGACDWLTQSIAITPEAGYGDGDTIKVFHTIDNNPSGGTCLIDSVAFYQSEVSVTPTWEYVTSHVHGIFLPKATALVDSFSYVVPAYGTMCLRALLYSSCCAEPQEETRCFTDSIQCPPGSVCSYFAALKLSDADQYIERPVDPFPPGWIYDTIQVPPDTTFYMICTHDGTPIGTAGSVVVYYHIASGWHQFTFRVRQDWHNGDLCGGPNGQVDCIVNLQDVGCLINLVFRGGMPPTPNPEEHGDVNCDGIYNVSDVVRLVDYVFRGGYPPPDCGAGPTM